MRGCLQLMGYRRKGFMAKLNLEVGLKRLSNACGLEDEIPQGNGQIKDHQWASL